MTLLVDAAAGAVVDGERRWPLRLDCRTGAAVVTFGDRELAIAPLQWRHKLRLARWAHLGADFVASQRAALVLDRTEEWDDEDIRVVAAVAEFLDGATLPLAPELLAEVAIEACRATGLAPVAFDDRDAYDVESIWRVGSGAAPVAPHPATARAVGATGADPWADSTSIVLVADPPLDARPAARPDPTIVGAEVDDVRPERSSGLDVAAPEVAAADDIPAPDDHPTSSRTEAARSTPVRHDARRYRVAPAVGPVRHSVRPAAPAVTTIADRHAVAADQAGPPPRPDSPPAPLPTWSQPANALGSIEVTTAGGPLIAPAAPASTTARRGPGRWADLAVADAFPPRPAPGTEIDDDARLDELVDAVASRLADQLAMTSDDLGIEV